MKNVVVTTVQYKAFTWTTRINPSSTYCLLLLSRMVGRPPLRLDCSLSLPQHQGSPPAGSGTTSQHLGNIPAASGAPDTPEILETLVRPHLRRSLFVSKRGGRDRVFLKLTGLLFGISLRLLHQEIIETALSAFQNIHPDCYTQIYL